MVFVYRERVNHLFGVRKRPVCRNTTLSNVYSGKNAQPDQGVIESSYDCAELLRRSRCAYAATSFGWSVQASMHHPLDFLGCVREPAHALRVPALVIAASTVTPPHHHRSFYNKRRSSRWLSVNTRCRDTRGAE